MEGVRSIKPEQYLETLRTPENRQLIAQVESLATALSQYVDIHKTPASIFDKDMEDTVIEHCMTMVQPHLDKFAHSYEGSGHEKEYVFLESLTGDENEEPMAIPMEESHQQNLRQLMENSFASTRQSNPNQRNLNEFTPFDAYLPFVIIRSYLPMVANQVFPYIVPAKDFIRIKENRRYIVTKDNQRLLRPDVYTDMPKVRSILESARGRRVTEEFYPIGEHVDITNPNDPEEMLKYDYIGTDGECYKIPENGVKLTDFDLLGESGGISQYGDALDINIHISGLRGVVTDSLGKDHVVNVSGVEIYPDITSISPQRSIYYVVRYPVQRDDGTLETFVEDRIYGDYNARESSFNVSSLTGVTRQVQFGGNLSNKTNTEWLSFDKDTRYVQHPIAEGYSGNVPITDEDRELYRKSGEEDIITNAVNEFTEIFTQLEDTSCFIYANDKFNTYKDMGANHGFEHFEKGPVVFLKSVNVKYDTSKLLKQSEYVQDRVQAAITSMIRRMRDTCANEPFRLVATSHPNIATLFVGQNVDWKITPGGGTADGIREDYNMGIYLNNGDSFRLVTSQKFPEADGIRFYLYPVNEQNFMTWKHFKLNMWFSNQYQIKEMLGIPNIRCVSRFETKSYTPLQGQLLIYGYDDV